MIARTPGYIPSAICKTARRRLGFNQTYPGSDYTDDELEFLRAVDRYKTSTRRPNPTAAEILQIVKSLGYRKVLAEA